MRPCLVVPGGRVSLNASDADAPPGLPYDLGTITDALRRGQ
jgi:hypothetical protein